MEIRWKNSFQIHSTNFTDHKHNHVLNVLHLPVRIIEFGREATHDDFRPNSDQLRLESRSMTSFSSPSLLSSFARIKTCS